MTHSCGGIHACWCVPIIPNSIRASRHQLSCCSGCHTNTTSFVVVVIGTVSRNTSPVFLVGRSVCDTHRNIHIAAHTSFVDRINSTSNSYSFIGECARGLLVGSNCSMVVGVFPHSPTPHARVRSRTNKCSSAHAGEHPRGSREMTKYTTTATTILSNSIIIIGNNNIKSLVFVWRRRSCCWWWWRVEIICSI